MINVALTLLGRPTIDGEFVEIWAGSVQVGDETVTITPVVPPEAAGQELVVDVVSTGLSINFAGFALVQAEPAAGPDPAPGVPRLERATAVYATVAGQTRRAPFRGTVIGLCQYGSPTLG